MGEIGILNVGAGDTKLVFDKTKPEDCRRAAEIISDMLKRGFAILVEVGQDDQGPLYRRATGFDPETMEYIIVGLPEDQAPSVNVQVDVKSPAPRRGRPYKTKVPADKTTAVAVARSAGG